MGNRAFLFFALLSSLLFSPMALAKNKASSGKSKADINDMCGRFAANPEALQNFFKGMDYVGVDFSNAGMQCVNAYTDGEAITKCIVAGKGLKILNPGNPQYKLAGNENGDRTSNKLGFYFCFNSEFNDKKRLCDLAAAESRYNKDRNLKPTDPEYVGFKWVGAKKGTDGDCFCNLPNSTLKSEHGFQNCAQKPPESKAPETEKDETAEAKLCKQRNGVWETNGHWFSCVCRSGKPSATIELSESSASCELGGELRADYQPSNELRNCVNNQESLIAQCKQEAPKAKEQCTQGSVEAKKEFQSKAGFVKTLSDTIISQKTGSGSMAQCAGASILSGGLIELLRPEETSCDENLESCKETCTSAEKKFVDVCKSFVSSDEATAKEDNKFLENFDKTHAGTLADPIKLCTKDAVDESISLKKAIASTNEAQSSAARCACQLSTTGAPNGVGDCNNLPTALDCNSNPTLPGCTGVVSMTCVVGSGDYASAKCECLRNPSAAICKTGSDGKLPSSFPGIDLSKGPFTSSGTTFGDTGGGGGGNMDFGSMNAELAGNQKPGAPGEAPGFGASPGGGGGGGGGLAGGGGAGAGEEGAPGEGGEKPDLGLLGQIKSTIGNLFGGGKGGGRGGGASGANGKLKTRPDVDAWRPRGLASTGCKSSQVRCKNETIWEIMNNRYDQSNGTFLRAAP